MTTPEQAELRRLAEAATPGPWLTAAFQLVIDAARRIDVGMCGHRDDAAFIAAANPATVLALLDERDALAAKVERVRALHFGEYVEDEDQNRCFECGDDYPCPTIRAIDGEADA